MTKKEKKILDEKFTYEVQILVQEELRLVRVRTANIDVMDAGDILFSDSENTITAFFSSAVLVAFYLVDSKSGEALSIEEVEVGDTEESDFELDD